MRGMTYTSPDLADDFKPSLGTIGNPRSFDAHQKETLAGVDVQSSTFAITIMSACTLTYPVCLNQQLSNGFSTLSIEVRLYHALPGIQWKTRQWPHENEEISSDRIKENICLPMMVGTSVCEPRQTIHKWAVHDRLKSYAQDDDARAVRLRFSAYLGSQSRAISGSPSYRCIR